MALPALHAFEHPEVAVELFDGRVDILCRAAPFVHEQSDMATELERHIDCIGAVSKVEAVFGTHVLNAERIDSFGVKKLPARLFTPDKAVTLAAVCRSAGARRLKSDQSERSVTSQSGVSVSMQL